MSEGDLESTRSRQENLPVNHSAQSEARVAKANAGKKLSLEWHSPDSQKLTACSQVPPKESACNSLSGDSNQTASENKLEEKQKKELEKKLRKELTEEMKSVGKDIRAAIKDSQLAALSTGEFVVVDAGVAPIQIGDTSWFLSRQADIKVKGIVVPDRKNLQTTLDWLHEPLAKLHELDKIKIDKWIPPGKEKEAKASWSILNENLKSAAADYPKLVNYLKLPDPECRSRKTVKEFGRNAFHLEHTMEKSLKDYHNFLHDMGVPRIVIWFYSVPRDIKLSLDCADIWKSIKTTWTPQASKLFEGNW